MTAFSLGDHVRWTDPDEGTCSGPGTVVGVHGDVYAVEKDDGSEVEAFESELSLEVRNA